MIYAATQENNDKREKTDGFHDYFSKNRWGDWNW